MTRPAQPHALTENDSLALRQKVAAIPAVPG